VCLQVCDSIAPIIAQPPNVPCVEATSPLGAVVTFTAPRATDAGDANVQVTCVKPSGSGFPVGTSTVVCSATDKSGNAAVAVTFTIQVCDHTPPVITNVPSGLPCVEATSAAGAVVTFAQPIASDIVAGAVLVSCVPASGTVFAVGTTTVTCTAADRHGNTATASFPVQVNRLSTVSPLHPPLFCVVLCSKQPLNSMPLLCVAGV
jgi:hypothetical protein